MTRLDPTRYLVMAWMVDILSTRGMSLYGQYLLRNMISTEHRRTLDPTLPPPISWSRRK
jgi:hypothetical protein